MKVYQIPLKDLKPAEYNPRAMTEKEAKDLKESLTKFGMVEPIVVNKAKGRHNVIIGGHQRYNLLKLLGRKSIPVVYVDIPKIEDEQELNLRLNKNLGHWAWDMLANFDEKLLEKVGFDLTELEQFFSKEIEEFEGETIKNFEDIKILNLYAGIGGNRRLWGNLKITAVEYNEEIANIYKDYFPNDEVIIGDAHKYLEENFDKYDFIWSSPPCPTHSLLRKGLSIAAGAKPKYPDMKLYEEILFLQGYFKGKYIVENVRSWYDPLIEPQERGRHYYWTNFDIPESDIFNRTEVGSPEDTNYSESSSKFGFNLDKYKISSKYPKDKILRNMVHPEIGKFILENAYKKINEKSRQNRQS